MVTSAKKYLLFIAFIVSSSTFAQHSNYDQHEAFAPLFYPAYGDKVRAADGTPGPDWQNRADYSIQATMDDSLQNIQGAVTITSDTNNSPQALLFVWLQLDQNIYDQESRSVAVTTVTGGRWANRNAFDGGYTIESVSATENGKEQQANYNITDSRMQIKLANPVKAGGGNIQFKIAFHFAIPEYGTEQNGLSKHKKWMDI